ncbi:peptidase M16 inactive domain containing protein, partial [Acanthamoeba castellanii str. Neff]
SLNFSGSALLLASAQRRWATTAATDVRPLKPKLERGPSMKSPLLDMPTPLAHVSQLKTPSTRITTLRNGVRVATEETYGQATAMGVFVDAGSRNETFETNGTTHVLQRMGFKATTNRTSAEIVQKLESLGVNAISSSSREAMVYTAEVVRGDVEEVVEVLADSVTNPLLLEEDLQEQKIAVGRELEDMVHDPPSWLPEILHELAYGPEGLGLSHLCPPSNLEHIGREQLHNFVKTYYVGPRVVVAAAGVEHDSFVKLCAKHFDSLPAAEGGKPLHVPSVYKGGAHVEFMSPENEKRLQELQAESDKPPPSHVALVFEGSGLNDPDLYATCVLQSLLGGGSSFSSGGPGKGMYTRLYRRVLNNYGFVDSASCFNSFYLDSGLFGIYSTVQHKDIGNMLHIMSVELVDLTGFSAPIGQEEFDRAKNQLRSGIFMNLEQRAVLCDDIGRQVLSYGERKSAQELSDLIEKVTIEDVMRVARRILSTKPTLVVYTPEKYATLVPSHERLCAWFDAINDKLNGKESSESK